VIELEYPQSEYDPELDDCTWCGGDGDEDCNDPLQCTKAHDEFGMCSCPACGGSGRAKDQTLW
jgi:hypothetical protein